jgi:hypothetical protein
MSGERFVVFIHHCLLYLLTFRQNTLRTAEAISNALPGCKWQNLPFAECKLLEERSSLYSQFRVVKADEGLGPGIISDSLYYDALKRTLYYKAKTYEEFIGVQVTTDTILGIVDAEFKACTAKFRGREAFGGLFYTLTKWQDNCLLQPHLCPIYLLPKVHILGIIMEVRPIVPNKLNYTCQQ